MTDQDKRRIRVKWANIHKSVVTTERLKMLTSLVTGKDDIPCICGHNCFYQGKRDNNGHMY